jgi:putative NADPH-quinone reductase
MILTANPDERSFSRVLGDEIAKALRDAGAEVSARDVAQCGIDPSLSAEEARRRFSFDEHVQAEQQRIADSKLLVWIHPDWWGGMPAALKGWIDRVLQPGFAFSFEEDEAGRIIRLPLLKGKRALAVITSDAGTEEPVPAVDIWQQRIFSYCGFGPAEVMLLPELKESAYAERKAFIEACGETARRLFADEE